MGCMKTEMLTVISNYGEVLKGFGVERPVFLMNRECRMAIMNPDGMEFKSEKWEPCESLPEDIAQRPGVVGMYDGVLLVAVYNQ